MKYVAKQKLWYGGRLVPKGGTLTLKAGDKPGKNMKPLEDKKKAADKESPSGGDANTVVSK